MASIPKDYTKSVLTSIQRELESLGFEKREARVFVLEASADMLGTVGLNTATGRSANVYEVNPVVGIRSQQIERLVSELSGDAFDEVVPPTLAGNIGYLSPENQYLPFLFAVDEKVEDKARQLCDVVRLYGIPFIKEMTTLENLVNAMQTARFGIPFVTEYRIPVGMLLLGDHAKAEAFLTAKLAKIETHGDPAAVRYRRFAARLLERLRG